MPKKSLAVSVDITIYSVTCPGVFLKDRDDIFLEVCVFGLHKQSQPVPAVFPLYFNERFKFHKVFYNCVSPLDLHEALSNETVTVEVVQKSRFIHAGVVLASIELTSKDFLFPYPSAVPVYSGADRELLLSKTLHFNGISPKIEFASHTSVNEVHTTAADELSDKIAEINRENNGKIGSRSASPTRALNRSKSLSSFKGTALMEKPPFVVRKVDRDILKMAEPMAATVGHAPLPAGRRSRSKRRKSGKRSKSAAGRHKTYLVEKHYDDYDVSDHDDFNEKEEPLKFEQNGFGKYNLDVAEESEEGEEEEEADQLGKASSKVYSSAPVRKSYDDARAERFLSSPVDYDFYPSEFSDLVLDRLERKRLLEELERDARLSRLHGPYLSSSETYAQKYEQELYWARKRRELERSLDRLYDRLYRLH